MTPLQTPPGSRPSVPEIDLLAVDWRRVQVLLHVRPTGEALDPPRLRLRHEGSGASVPVTGWEAGDDGVCLRFNVMQGPGQQPMAPGCWSLVSVAAGKKAHRPVRVLGPGASLAGSATARFALEGATNGNDGPVYVVEPSVSGRPPALALDIRLEAGGAANGNGVRGGRIPRPIRQSNVLVFRLLFRLSRLLARRNGRRILFTSDRRGELGGNLRLVHDRMVARGLDREYDLQSLFKPGIATRRSTADRFRLPWLLGRADVIVIDDFQPVIQHLDGSDVRIVQLWHAVGAFKTVGYSRVGKPGAPSPYGMIHKNYTRVIVSAHSDVPVYAEAFGIPESHVVPTGIPRVDPMFDPSHREGALARVRDAFPETVGRRVILFAPTFRGHGARSATYHVDRLDYAALHELCVEQDAVCLIRMHPFVRDPLGIPEPLRDRLIDASTPDIETNDLLFAIDLLVTDYSSIVFEYSTLGRPMLFYAYDLEDYVASRDFYEPYESFVPGRIVRTFDELLDAIRRGDFQVEKVAPFASRHFDHLDGDSTDRVIDLILAR